MTIDDLNDSNFHQPLFLKSGDYGILIIHGFSSSPGQVSALAFKLHEEKFTVSVPLLAGHGTTPDDLEKTDAQDWYHSAEIALLELKKSVKKIIIIGASFGGNLAFHLCRQYPKDVVGLISIMTPVHFYHERSLYLLIRLAVKFFRSIRKKGSSGVGIKNNQEFNDVGSYISLPLKSLLDFYRFIRQNTRNDLKVITKPILIIQTKKDGVIKPSSANSIYNLISSKEKKIFWIDSKYHAVPWPENYKIFSTAYTDMKKFISRCLADNDLILN